MAALRLQPAPSEYPSRSTRSRPSCSVTPGHVVTEGLVAEGSVDVTRVAMALQLYREDPSALGQLIESSPNMLIRPKPPCTTIGGVPPLPELSQ